MKSVTLFAMLSALFCTNTVQAQYDASLPIFTSDNIQSLQGIKQKVGTTVFEWVRPAASNTTLSKYIGAMAVNPSNLSQVFFVDNSSVPKLYTFNKNTSTETNTSQTFMGASQGSNGSATLPIIESESALGINMMTIRSNDNKGFAISKDNKLFTFSTVSPYLINSVAPVIADEPGNAVSFASAKGGGLMTNTNNNLTALVNVLQVDLTYKYYFFQIDPATAKAKFIKETFMNFNGFDDPTMFLSGVGVTNDGSIFNSLYNGNESSLYKYNSTTNSFNVNLATGNQAIGDVSGAGKVLTGSNLVLAINFSDVTGLFNGKEKTTAINWSVFSDEAISKYNVESSVDGINFKTVATQLPIAQNGQYKYKQTVSVTNNGITYYRIAAVRVNNTIKYSAIITVDETNNIKTSISTYPNPTTDFLNVKLSESKVIEQINILDSKGVNVGQIRTGDMPIANKQISLNQYNLKSGQYYLQVYFADKQKQTTAFSVQR
jgi:Secretion system C-terminal sorting domain